MEISTHLEAGGVAVLQLKGALDGSNYQSLIDAAQKLYDEGLRNILLDLSELTFMSSAGISAVHRTALIFRGEKLKAAEEGWAAYRTLNNDRESGVQQHVKLLSPSAKVLRSLEMIGFTSLFEIHADLQTALASFH